MKDRERIMILVLFLNREYKGMTGFKECHGVKNKPGCDDDLMLYTTYARRRRNTFIPNATRRIHLENPRKSRSVGAF
jgi:hypothetical protein